MTETIPNFDIERQTIFRNAIAIYPGIPITSDKPNDSEFMVYDATINTFVYRDIGGRGARGPKGPPGLKGPTGTVQGIRGKTGIRGDTGSQGIPGMVGMQGQKGLTGFQGIDGDRGSTGTTGSVGPRGISVWHVITDAITGRTNLCYDPAWPTTNTDNFVACENSTETVGVSNMKFIPNSDGAMMAQYAASGVNGQVGQMGRSSLKLGGSGTHVATARGSVQLGGDTGQAQGEAAVVLGGLISVASGLNSAVIAGTRGGARGTNSVTLGGIRSSANGNTTCAAGSDITIGGNNSVCFGNAITCNHDNCFVYARDATSSTAPNCFIAQSSNGINFYSNDAATLGVQLLPNATSWSSISERGKKRNVREVDDEEILSIVVDKLPVYQFGAVGDKKMKSMGVMAQDWNRCFANLMMGKDKLTVDCRDVDGVILSCIRALKRRYDDKISARRISDGNDSTTAATVEVA